ncbi:S-adenosyl-L-methionine-dependent methyltransferase [Hyaloscypha hepaticicola]|uniref:S-adenosyl-L-methionine-dependent methyltransferase n=1 Tax=Hyaloscypha hepaticicola TaxID=2082293 RepID=A0A2J6Q8X2_9HELO|nr:S-adenosyl-L-methionine-dependent methyltransferase [Hyaloscypha hepaticicola]
MSLTPDVEAAAAAAETGDTPPAPPAPAATQIIVADDPDDGDSAIGEEQDFVSTTSITSSIYKFREENGRTYNAYGDRTYWLPNDEDEKSRLDLQHHLFQLTLGGKLFTAPIDPKKTLRVLDVGTGTGIWAIDYADEHPQAEVLGVDVSPIQPSFVPPNVRFEVDDAEKPWSYAKEFDFIFSRMMTGSFGNWRAYIQECFDHTNPGGYLEVEDILSPPQCQDDTLKGTALEKWGNLFLESSIKLGVPLDSALSIKKNMEEAGYVDVVQVIYEWPMNKWPADKNMKTIGLWSHEATTATLSDMTTALFGRGLGWTPEEVEVFLVDVRKDMKNPRIHAYWPIYVVHGKKPE